MSTKHSMNNHNRQYEEEGGDMNNHTILTITYDKVRIYRNTLHQSNKSLNQSGLYCDGTLVFHTIVP